MSQRDELTDESTEELIAGWKQEEQETFAGWDFSHLDDRMIEDQPPWSYVQRAGELLQDADRALDMGVGGGERLLELRKQWPRVLVATEDYPPNVFLSAQRLASYGVGVVVASLSETDPLPFGSGGFDVVLNRHSGLNPQEVARVLSPSGVFYTQQIHGLWALDLLAVFEATPQWPDAPTPPVSFCTTTRTTSSRESPLVVRQCCFVEWIFAFLCISIRQYPCVALLACNPR